MTLYKLRNRVNGLEYIGLTVRGIKSRMANHLCHAMTRNSKRPLYADIRKYGIKSFELLIIGAARTYEELLAMEMAAIREHATLYPNGYNLTVGGEGTLGAVCSEATRAKIAAKATGRRCPDEVRERLSKALKGRIPPNKGKKTGRPAWNAGLKASDATRQKQSAMRKGRPHAGRPVLINGIRFEKIIDASAALGIHEATITYRATREIMGYEFILEGQSQ